MKKSDRTVLLLGKSIFSKDKSSLLKYTGQEAYRLKRPLILFTPNPEQLVLASKNADFDALLRHADILIPDGVGLVLASRFLALAHGGPTLSERIAGIDVAVDLLSLASRKKWQTLLVGGKNYGRGSSRAVQLPADVSHVLTAKMQWTPGYTNVARPTKEEEREVITTLRQLKPKIVFVAFGAPHQEQWVVDHLAELEKAGVEIVMVVGGAFDVLLGKLRRAPLSMRSFGLEWLYRLIQEPHRWRRQLALFEFGWLTLRALFQPKK